MIAGSTILALHRAHEAGVVGIGGKRTGGPVICPGIWLGEKWIIFAGKQNL
jgi:hypothetical protein